VLPQTRRSVGVKANRRDPRSTRSLAVTPRGLLFGFCWDVSRSCGLGGGRTPTKFGSIAKDRPLRCVYRAGKCGLPRLWRAGCWL